MACANRLIHSHRKSRGVAIISVLLVVVLSAVLVSGLLYRQQVLVRRIENQRLLEQTRWVERSVLDWTRLLLHADADTGAGITYLGGTGSVAIARRRLSGDNLSTEDSATWLSGSIEDEQASFNLRNLVMMPAPGVLQLNLKQIECFRRLLVVLGFDGSLAKNAAVQVQASLLRSATRFQTQNVGGAVLDRNVPIQSDASGGNTTTNNSGLSNIDDNSAVAPLQFTSVDSLLDVRGFTPEIVSRLRSFVTVLPTATAVNMNTASAEVVAAVVPGMNLSSAQAFVSRRKTAVLRNVGDVRYALQSVGVQQAMIDPNELNVNTRYFLVRDRVQHERAEVDRTTLVYRDALTHATRIVPGFGRDISAR
ncbi:type II secretion system minor pseudopilin GspK [Burkholderia ambifaria]|uniref:type II secretion system minor pseudopilin GspK n=1 Tax=Burkholderia ambifaria TaxID=152480 RepID=UPI001FC8484A|nr:type II secretion system minor pseudopilin GspK [Burkholderia ambifaria]